MELTCLSKGRGYYFPPCHILDVCGFTILIDCPLDLSALAAFAPIPHECSVVHGRGGAENPVEKPIDASSLIHAEPWYKTVATLHLWDVSSVDVVLISSPMGILGLPFLTRADGFSAKIYMTEAAAKLGSLMMKDLVSLHREFREFYGVEESIFPRWMKWEELELLPPALKEIVVGVDGVELGGWMPLYSAADAEDCVKKVKRLRYAEETCYNGTLIIKALSSGLEIGACNWTIEWSGRSIALVTRSMFASGHALEFNHCALRSKEVLVFSDFSSLDDIGHTENGTSYDSSPSRNLETLLGDAIVRSKEKEQLDFICSCMIHSIEAGGSVLIPMGGLGVILQLLEQLSVCSEFISSKVPIYIISSVAEEILAYTNIIPEWVCKQRQEKLFSGDPLFGHQELVKGERLRAYPAIHSRDLLLNWQEPCIIFCPHWSLRLGPAVPLLRRWHGDPNSLLVLEEGVDAHLALAPIGITEMKMKVLWCSFLSGIQLKEIKPLLDILQPNLAVLPEDFKQKIQFSDSSSFSMAHYSINETLRLPSPKDGSKTEISADLVSQFQWKTFKEPNLSTSRLKGKFVMQNGKPLILSGDNLSFARSSPLMHWGSPDLQRLLTGLTEMGIRWSLQEITDSNGESKCSSVVFIHDPEEAVIEVARTCSSISASSDKFATFLFEAVTYVLDGI